MEKILATRNVRLIVKSVEMAEVRRRLDLSLKIAAFYSRFEIFRASLLSEGCVVHDPATLSILETMARFGIAMNVAGKWTAVDAQARRYLTGGWFEEYLAAATEQAGADEVHCGGKIAWEVGGFKGENEIDVLALFGERLFFCSCKALKSRLAGDDAATRVKLTSALHEADNLADHFAPGWGVVALAVTTDLIDERFHQVRYEPFHGKALALGVNLLSDRKLEWPFLVSEIGRLMKV